MKETATYYYFLIGVKRKELKAVCTQLLNTAYESTIALKCSLICSKIKKTKRKQLTLFSRKKQQNQLNSFESVTSFTGDSSDCGKSLISNFHGLLKQDPNGSLLNEMVSPIPCIILILQHFFQKEEST